MITENVRENEVMVTSWCRFKRATSRFQAFIGERARNIPSKYQAAVVQILTTNLATPQRDQDEFHFRVRRTQSRVVTSVAVTVPPTRWPLVSRVKAPRLRLVSRRIGLSVVCPGRPGGNASHGPGTTSDSLAVGVMSVTVPLRSVTAIPRQVQLDSTVSDSHSSST